MGNWVLCPTDTDCVDGYAFESKVDAQSVFDTNVRSTADTEENTSHYIFGDYWYTNDLIDEYDSVSTGIHRRNSGIALITQMLTSSLDSEKLHTLYADLSNNDV